MIPYPFILFLNACDLYKGSTWNRMCWPFCSRSIAHLSLQSLHAILARLRKFDHMMGCFGGPFHINKNRPNKIHPKDINGLIGSPESAAATPSCDFLAKTIARNPHGPLAPYPLAKFQMNPFCHPFSKVNLGASNCLLECGYTS